MTGLARAKLCRILRNMRIRSSTFLPHMDYSVSVAGSVAEEDLRMDALVDEINAYTYLYPVELPSKKVLFKW